MSSLLSQLPTAFSRQSQPQSTQRSYHQHHANPQNKLLCVLRALISGFLILLTLYSRANEPSLPDALSKNLHFIGALAILSIPTPWPTIQNLIFLSLLCLLMVIIPSDILLIFDQDGDSFMLIVGYVIGTIEALIALTIGNSSYRVLIQIILALGKVFRLQTSLVSLTSILALISIIFFQYHDSLDRKHSQGTSLKFQKVLTEDLPIKVLITSIDLKQTLYRNQYFIQSFPLSHPQNIDSSFFQKIRLESDEINRQNIAKISLYTFLTETTTRLKPGEVLNLYSSYQEQETIQRHYEIKVKKTLYENDTPAYVIIFNDVSGNQRATALREADEQRDRVLATITHELKTPINGILGLLEMVSFRTKDSVSKAYLEHCKNCCKLLLYLVNSIVDLSQLRKNNLQIEKAIFSLDDLLKEVQSLYTFISEHRGLQFIVQKTIDTPNYIYTDKYRLISVLVQLIGNAMKFTFKGFVSLRVEVNPKNRQKLTFIVQDTGVGISPEDQIKLFSMFGQITEKNKNINHHGAGLGMTIANELVGILNDPKEHIDYKSEVNKGSTFRFNIDFTIDDQTHHRLNKTDSFAENTWAERELGAGSLEHSIKAIERSILENRKGFSVTSKGSLHDTDVAVDNQGKKRVLIVDDNPFNLVAASFIVSKLDLQAVTAANGNEAISMLQESMNSGQHFSFILMDIQMPIMDGIQTTKMICQMIQRGELYSVPVVALTAKKIDSQEISLYKECGMFDALGKPLIEQELKNIFKRICT